MRKAVHDATVPETRMIVTTAGSNPNNNTPPSITRYPLRRITRRRNRVRHPIPNRDLVAVLEWGQATAAGWVVVLPSRFKYNALYRRAVRDEMEKGGVMGRSQVPRTVIEIVCSYVIL